MPDDAVAGSSTLRSHFDTNSKDVFTAFPVNLDNGEPSSNIAFDSSKRMNGIDVNSSSDKLDICNNSLDCKELLRTPPAINSIHNMDSDAGFLPNEGLSSNFPVSHVKDIYLIYKQHPSYNYDTKFYPVLFNNSEYLKSVDTTAMDKQTNLLHAPLLKQINQDKSSYGTSSSVYQLEKVVYVFITSMTYGFSNFIRKIFFDFDF